jgi:AraC family transcriptional activator of pobA
LRKSKAHIPFLKSIEEFFSIYGLGKPLHPGFMCMRLQDQPDGKLEMMPLCRSNFFRILLFTKANLQFSNVQHSYEVIDNCMCFTYPGKLESWKREGKLYGYVIYFTADFTKIDPLSPRFEKDFPFFNFDSEPFLLLNDQEASLMKANCKQMIMELHSDREDRFMMLQKLLDVYLIQIKRVYQKNLNSLSPQLKSSKNLYNRFRKELDNHMQALESGKKELTPTVSLIAGLLMVNANYLNSVLKQLTGKTASEHIQEKLVLEAKSFLLHTNLQASEIAYKLGFDNASYFSRFFKKCTGTSPLLFRGQYKN